MTRLAMPREPEEVHHDDTHVLMEHVGRERRSVSLARNGMHSEGVRGVRAHARPGLEIRVPQVEPVEHLKDKPTQPLPVGRTLQPTELRLMEIGHAEQQQAGVEPGLIRSRVPHRLEQAYPRPGLP